MTSTDNCKVNNLHTVRFLLILDLNSIFCIYRLTWKIPFINNIIQNHLFICWFRYLHFARYTFFQIKQLHCSLLLKFKRTVSCFVFWLKLSWILCSRQYTHIDEWALLHYSQNWMHSSRIFIRTGSPHDP